jgi:hypothetical protein
MRKSVLLTAVMILMALSSTAAIKSLIPVTHAAATPQTVSVEDLQRHVDAKSLPVMKVDEPY